MFGTISAALDIGEKTPPAIDYFYNSPHPQWVPDVALKKAHQNRNFLLSVVGLHNLSAKVLTSIRIKLPFAPEYEPVIHLSSAVIEANYERKIHEIQIQRLDPGEKIYVGIFLARPEADKFTEPQVIISDRLLSRGMRTVGYFKSQPKQALMLLLPIVLTVAALFATGYAIYIVSPFNPRVKAVEEAFAGHSGCFPTAYEKVRVNETLLAKHKLGEPFLLQLNRVVSRKDLFDKDYVVICEDR